MMFGRCGLRRGLQGARGLVLRGIMEGLSPFLFPVPCLALAAVVAIVVVIVIVRY